MAIDRNALTERREELEHQLQDAASAGESSRLEKLSREHAHTVEHLRLLTERDHMQNQLADARSMQADGDADMLTLGREEEERIQKELGELDIEIQNIERPRDPLDARDALIEIRAGAGGDESGLFAAELARMYTRFAERRGWSTNTVDANRTGIGGYKEIIFEVHGDAVYGLLRLESGVHRVQRVPDTEKSGRVHTSTATVAVLPIVEDEDLTIKPEDVKIEATTSSGHGGQSVNTTYSAIRMTHLPTGIVVKMQDERSQKQNKEKAMEILRARVFALEQEKRLQAASDLRKSQIGTGDRSEKIRTYNFPQDRMTDHRLKENYHNLTSIMDGDIEPVLLALQEARRDATPPASA